MAHAPVSVLILAAGEGSRMKSATPKVLHAIGGRSLLGHAITAARGLEAPTEVRVHAAEACLYCMPRLSGGS